MKKLTSLVLALVLLTLVFGMSVSAQEREITRAQAAEIVIGLFPEYTGTEDVIFNPAPYVYFLDLPGDSESRTTILKLKDLGIIKGDGDGNVRPDEKILTEEIAVMLVRALGYESLAVESGGFPNGYMKVAEEIGLLKDTAKTAGEYADEQTAKTMYNNALDIPKRLATEYNALTQTAAYSTESKITYRADKEEYAKEYVKPTPAETDNFEETDIRPVEGVSFVGEDIVLEQGQTSICVDFTQVINPKSNYYISLYKVALYSKEESYVVKYFGPVSADSFKFTGLEEGYTYRILLSSSVNTENATGRIYAY